MSEWVRVGALAEVAEGEIRGYELGWGRVVVAHAPGGVFALGDECPGDGCALSEGRLTDGGELACSCDGSRFDVETGEPVGGPAEDLLATFPVRVLDGWIEVAGEV